MATIDLADLLPDDGEEVAPSLKLGDREHVLPPHVPQAFLSALANLSWAKRVDSASDIAEANAKLMRLVTDLAGPFADGSVPADVLLRAILQAYGLGEGSASSD